MPAALRQIMRMLSMRLCSSLYFVSEREGWDFEEDAQVLPGVNAQPAPYAHPVLRRQAIALPPHRCCHMTHLCTMTFASMLHIMRRSVQQWCCG